MYTGKKVRLRAYRPADLDDVLRQVNDYMSVRHSALGPILPATPDDEMRWIGQQTSMTRGEYQFAIETLNGQYVGGCGFQHVDWKNRAAHIGILIGNAAMRGKGYGSDAIRVLCRIGFAEMNLHKISLTVIEGNEAAIRCYIACGFSMEGKLRDEIFREDAYHDLIAMGILRDEWRTRSEFQAPMQMESPAQGDDFDPVSSIVGLCPAAPNKGGTFCPRPTPAARTPLIK
ncbi:MAG: GNAT family N-acetyltransferase [Oscillospiraceae bacterium]|nr:GNAT family N-acetyltransferase [Oscillospiraceae bacterium]